MCMIYNETEYSSYSSHDVMQEAVYEKAKNILQQYGLCCCKACCSAVTGHAMCDLPAMRATNVAEDIHIRFALMEQQLQANILVAISKAMEQTGVSSGACVAAQRCNAL